VPDGAAPRAAADDSNRAGAEQMAQSIGAHTVLACLGWAAACISSKS
jgi:hypothetical protein